jgi:hypothetical protein
MHRLLFVFMLCALVNTARADDTSDYSYIRLGYTEETLSDEFMGETVFSGHALDLSWGYNDRLAFIANYYSADPEQPLRGFSSQAGIFLPLRAFPQEFFGLGALYHMPLGADTDLQLALEAGRAGFWSIAAVGPTRREDSGTRITAGLSSRFFGRLEGKLLLRHFAFPDSDPSVFIGVEEITDTIIEANYFLFEKYSAGLSFIKNDITDRFVVSVGYSF